MNLADLNARCGKQKKKMRVGRGAGSGKGGTSGRGHKGYRSRSGSGGRIWYEGGQMPLYRRIPQRGFTNIFKKYYTIVNVGDLDRFEDGTVVDEKILKESGLIKKVKDGIKVLGNGNLTKKLKVIAHKFSKSAQGKIKAKDGEVVIIK